MATISMELSDHVFSSLRLAPEDISKELRLAAAALWYSQGRLSQEVAANLCGLDRTDFILALARMGIDTFQVDFNDLDGELSRE